MPLSFEEYKAALGDGAKNLTDEEITILWKGMTALVRFAYEVWREERRERLQSERAKKGDEKPRL